jgi:hypothetical protein
MIRKPTSVNTPVAITNPKRFSQATSFANTATCVTTSYNVGSLASIGVISKQHQRADADHGIEPWGTKQHPEIKSRTGRKRHAGISNHRTRRDTRRQW